MTKLHHQMTEAERQCYLALRKWQRRQLRSEWLRALRPRAPYARQLTQFGLGVKLVYWLVLTLALPLLLLVYCGRLLVRSLCLPPRYLASYMVPRDLRPPGERTIQGVHNAFMPFAELAPHFYLACVDDWVRILFGVERSLAEFIDQSMIGGLRYLEGGHTDRHARHILAHARENLSRSLGNYH